MSISSVSHGLSLLYVLGILSGPPWTTWIRCMMQAIKVSRQLKIRLRAVAEPQILISVLGLVRARHYSCDFDANNSARLSFSTEPSWILSMATISSKLDGGSATKLVVPSVETIHEPIDTPPHASPARGRKRRRHSAISASPADRSPSPSRGHGRKSASRHREKRRWRHHRTTSSERSDFSSVSRHEKSSPAKRRRSDAQADHTFRGRARERSRSRTENAIAETSIERLENGQVESAPRAKLSVKAPRRKRSLPPSRGSRSATRTGDESPQQRRQRSLPNQYYGTRDTAKDRSEG